MNNKGLTLTVLANMTSNYGEGLGNVSSVQKVFRNGKVYATRSRESLKNAIMVQSGFYDDLQVTVDKVTQKLVNDELNASNCRALEGGYMNTGNTTKIRKSSFYLTDAVSCDEFVNETRFHTNLYLAQKYAEENNIGIQDRKSDKDIKEEEERKKAGLMPYQYEYDKSLKQYSITFDLDKIGIDENYNESASNKEKADRVITILNTIKNLYLVVKGNLDNAEPLLIFGGLGDYKTHYFENVVKIKDNRLEITKDLKDRLNKGYKVAILEGGNFENEEEIIDELNTISMEEFFNGLEEEVKKYYGE